MTTDGKSHRVSLLILILSLLAALSAVWPAYRAFVNVEIDINEGWNAYFADAALGRMPLYPSRDQLITNNYPPLSFYIVGGLGRLIGDTVLAGRLLSLAAVAALAVMAALAIKRLGGNATAAAVGALYFLATMCRFFTDYVGMNDPQLLAQAVMSVGFLMFLRRRGPARPNRRVCGDDRCRLPEAQHYRDAADLSAVVWLAATAAGAPLRGDGDCRDRCGVRPVLCRLWG